MFLFKKKKKITQAMHVSYRKLDLKDKQQKKFKATDDGNIHCWFQLMPIIQLFEYKNITYWIPYY